MHLNRRNEKPHRQTCPTIHQPSGGQLTSRYNTQCRIEWVSWPPEGWWIAGHVFLIATIQMHWDSARIIYSMSAMHWNQQVCCGGLSGGRKYQDMEDEVPVMGINIVESGGWSIYVTSRNIGHILTFNIVTTKFRSTQQSRASNEGSISSNRGDLNLEPFLCGGGST
jgi:hypothetical protein